MLRLMWRRKGRHPKSSLMADHIPYPKIAESTRHWSLRDDQQRELDRASWIVTEKLHGANLCLICDGQRVQGAKRKALLTPGEPFFNAQRVIARLTGPILALFERLAALYPKLQHIALYGELYGGAYPHDEVPPIKGLEPVQTGVWYCPQVDFCAFDLSIKLENHPPRFRDWLEALPLIEACDIMAAQPLAQGSLGELAEYPTVFDSTIPARHGLPPLPEPNWAEGVILRPTLELLLNTPQGPLRPLFKRKNPRFAEDARYHQAQAWGARDMPSEPLAFIEWTMRAMLNPNRVAAAISKVGPPQDQAQRDALAHALVEDIWDDLTREHDALLATLSSEDHLLLRAVLYDEAALAL